MTICPVAEAKELFVCLPTVVEAPVNDCFFKSPMVFVLLEERTELAVALKPKSTKTKVLKSYHQPCK